MKKVFVITGSTSGIGNALLKILVKGSIVFAGYRNEKYTEELEKLGAIPFYIDMEKPSSIAQAAAFIKSKTEDYDMNQKMNPFAAFNSMNQMGNQMMMNMMNMMGGNNQQGFCQPQQPFSGMAFNPSLSIQQINQMITWINQNNQMSWQMMQMMYAQNCQIMQKLYQMIPNMGNMPFGNMPFGNMPNSPFAQQGNVSEPESEE